MWVFLRPLKLEHSVSPYLEKCDEILIRGTFLVIGVSLVSSISYHETYILYQYNKYTTNHVMPWHPIIIISALLVCQKQHIHENKKKIEKHKIIKGIIERDSLNMQ